MVVVGSIGVKSKYRFIWSGKCIVGLILVCVGMLKILLNGGVGCSEKCDKVVKVVSVFVVKMKNL